MNIQEVSDILGTCWGLRAPRFVLITDEHLEHQTHHGQTIFRGLQPKNRGDIIVLGGDADISTVPHESWHAHTGLGEMTAWPVGDRLARRYQRLSRFPTLKNLLKRDVKYQEVSGLSEFPNIGKYAGRVKLYKLVG